MYIIDAGKYSKQLCVENTHNNFFMFVFFSCNASSKLLIEKSGYKIAVTIDVKCFEPNKSISCNFFIIKY